MHNACLNKQATIIEGPDDSIHRTPAQCKAEGIAGSPMHTDSILCACKDASCANVAIMTVKSVDLTVSHIENLYVSAVHAV